MDIQQETGAKYKAFVIFDDCLSTKAFSSQLFVNLTTGYRHWNISIIITTQYIFKLNPTIRECCRYAIMFFQSTKRSIQALFESFGTYFENYEHFKKYLSDSTENHGFVLMDRRSESRTIDGVYRVIKLPSPEKLPEFKYEY